ncbi:hypothetical protein MMPV_000837 [Pyropia vietnamensis]
MEGSVGPPRGAAAVSGAASGAAATPPVLGALPLMGMYRPRAAGPDPERGGDLGAAAWGSAGTNGGRGGGVAATTGRVGATGVYSGGLGETRPLHDDTMGPHDMQGGGHGGRSLAPNSSGPAPSRKATSGSAGGGTGVVAAGGSAAGVSMDTGGDSATPAAAAASGPGAAGGWGGEAADGGGAPRRCFSPLLSERERKDYQRKLRNRETARVSNEKRKAKFLTLQADVESLRPKAAAAAALRAELLPLRAEVEALRGAVAALRAENARLLAENERYRSQHGYR